MEEDTGKKELQKIINCLKANNYNFEDLEQTKSHGYMIANFKKDIKYTDRSGNDINDRYIKIKIEFDSDFDYKTNYKNGEGDSVFDSKKGNEFIEKILSNSYGAEKELKEKKKK
jgi:hypothetical protein